jgi:hypothetical protein
MHVAGVAQKSGIWKMDNSRKVIHMRGPVMMCQGKAFRAQFQ